MDQYKDAAVSPASSRPSSQPLSRPSSSQALGPLKTGREVPEDDALIEAQESTSEKSPSVELNPKEPLPPITPQSAQSNVSQRESVGKTPPKILAFRRELNLDDTSGSPDKPLSAQTRASVPDSKAANKAVQCQTEWSWMEDMKQHQMIKSARRLSRASSRSLVSPLSDDDIPSGRSHGRKTPHKEGSSIRSSAIDRSSLRGASAVTMGSGTAVIEDTVSSPPYPPRDDEYGIPILHLDSESETSDEDSLYQYQYVDSELHKDDGGEEPDTLPSIGPPEILKYQRESTKQDIPVNEEETGTKDASKSAAPQAGGAFTGLCEFCNNPIKPFPSMEEQKCRPPEDLYCCNEYQEFVQFIVTHPLHDAHKEDKKIDIKPHPPYGSKQARKDAKERAAQRMRERELARQQAAIAAGVSGPTPGGGGAGGGANFYQFARQMKTINYQLSSQKCLEEGWTIRPPSPLFDPLHDSDIFEPEPLQPPWADPDGKARKRSLIFKYYGDGSKFIILFPDGTGNVFYPSGRVAISITSLEQGLYTYVIQDDDADQRVLGVFKPDGFAMCNYAQGSVRLCLDQIGGLELDPRGGRKRKWSWKEQIEHIHAPPIQPITFAMTHHLSIRIMSQDSMSLTFACNKRSCRFQIGARLKPVIRQGTQIGDMTLKLVDPNSFIPPEVDENELHRKECLAKIQSLLFKVQNLLRFPNSPKVDRLPTPPYITSSMKKIEEIRVLQRAKGKGKKGEEEVEAETAETPVITVN